MSKKPALSAVAEAVAVISPKLTSTVVSLFKSEETKLATIRTNQDKAIQAALDAMLIACDKPKALFLKGNAKTNAARGQIGKMFDDIVTANLTQGTANSYKSAFWIAFEKGIPFQRDLNNKKSTGNDNVGTGADKPKSGPIEKTDVPALHKTLSKALAQARILNQTIFAADLVDLITDTWPEFKETVLNK
jgi:hypothetical protein